MAVDRSGTAPVQPPPRQPRLEGRKAGGGLCAFTPRPAHTVAIERGVREERSEIHSRAGGQGICIARIVGCLGGGRATFRAPPGGESRILIEREGGSLVAVQAQGAAAIVAGSSTL